MPDFPALSGDRRTDVLIIGGGMAGLLTAHFLQQAGVDCLVAERGRIGGGNTRFTTAKITAQHGLCYQKIAARHGREAASLYYRTNVQALEDYAALCEGMDCGFERKDSFVYSRSNPALLEKELDVLGKIGVQAELVSVPELPMETVGAVRMRDQAQFDPMRFLAALTPGLPILENTPVLELRGCTAVTDRGTIRAERIVVTTHFPFLNKHGSYFIKLYQQRSYVLALENAGNVDGMYVDEAEGGLSFRSAGDLLLLGGGGARTGKPCEGWQMLRTFAGEYYPQAQERYAWAAQDCMSLDGMPYIGRYSALTANLLTATGFNKWGMTGAMVSARLLRDRLLGTKNPAARLFSPSRSMMRKQLLCNGGEAIRDYLTPSPKTCPHLGCSLMWNKAEHTWDCPCHGSRFTEEGKLLDNPANGDLIKKDRFDR